MRDMDVICLSSDDSNDDDDDVEIISYGGFSKTSDPPPLSEVRVDVEAVNVTIPRQYIDLTDPRWAFPELKLRKKLDLPNPPVIDLTESVVEETELQTEEKSQSGHHLEKGRINSVSNDQDVILLERSPKDSKSPQRDRGTKRPAQRRSSSPTQPKEENLTAKLCHKKTAVKLTLLPFHKTLVSQQNTSRYSDQFANDFSQMSLCFRQLNGNDEEPEVIGTLKTNLLQMEPLPSECLPEVMKSPTGHQINSSLSNEQLQNKESEHLQHPADCFTKERVQSDSNLNNHDTLENKLDSSHSYNHIPSPTFISSLQTKPPKEPLVFNLEHMELDQSESDQRCPSNHSSSHSLTPGVKSCKGFNSNLVSHASLSSMSNGNQSPISEQMLGEKTPEWQMETGTYSDALGSESPASLSWQEESDGEDVSKESRFRAVSREDRQYVCPVTLRKAMTAPARDLINEDYEISRAPEVLCRQSLSLVYSTIDENYPEGTLQLLSDLLQPGYYPPKDITSHLLRGILLDPQSPYHFSVQAFNLLMWTQRHHRVNKSTVPWDWELLTSVMSNQDSAKEHRCEVVRMLLEYVVQTLEDDYQAKCSTSVHHSMTKATLSCDQQFPHVRDVIRWLFSAIKKSTEFGKCKERGEQLRMVSLFQRMLALALEVDRCPALNSAKLSQELFHMVLSHMPPRAHRMLLLKSLQSKLLLCKLLEQLLDYACPQKISVPMSLSRLLHFLKNCTLAPDPTDGTERWQRWEELIHLLWMLLLSYNNAMKGYLSSSSTERRGKASTLVYKPEDMVTKPAVREAVESYLSRSRADLGQALPLHVEESLSYLQDYLLDVCQC
ncbi:uncharacterized protein simc1 [Austrofundulus limnaeus]|uniref:Uncharacterized protein simc1 n=1 Tax=Austrofundulus limnaeus TaxID=52670 RepID=A0A2I4B7X0_AUSLI|nr:PREDICTED: uncharacterized protein LOC106517488 [Austrofundulus limnaeus]